jgi:diacylglycerol kinase (ATP)
VESGPVYVVFNPASGRGRGARLVEPVLAALRARGVQPEHGLTTRGGEEGELAAKAVARGFRRIVAVGGDGTWGNVGHALISAGSGAALGLVAGGTGCDLAKSLDVPAQDVDAACAVIAAGETRVIDAGRIEGKHFLNVCGFGLDIAVIEDSWRVKWLKGDLLYLYCALRQVFRYPGFKVTVEADGQVVGEMDQLMLMIANARIFGGGFKLAPPAKLDDGRLDMIAFSNMSGRKRLPMMGRLLKGTHLETPEVKTLPASRFTLRFASPPRYETDGDWNEARSASLDVECVPAALPVLVPRPS